jgi:hypothetical protein
MACDVRPASGSTERVLYRTAEGLRDRGHEVHLFCGKFSIPPPAGVFGHRVPSLRWPRTARLLSFAIAAPKMVEGYGCDVLLSFDRILRQDIFRSGGGSSPVFCQKNDDGQPSLAPRLVHDQSVSSMRPRHRKETDGFERPSEDHRH